MERTTINKLSEHINEEVLVQGWVDVRRDHGKLLFFDFRDRTEIIQAVALPNNKEVFEIASTLRPEDVIEARAKVNKRPEKMVNSNQMNGEIELEILSITILSKSAELPFEKDAELNLDTALDNRPLNLRTSKNRAIFKVQHEIIQAYRAFLIEEGFIEFEAPKIVGGDAEGGSGVFRLEYLKEKWAYLATSPQLYKQIMVGVFERVFSIGNVFRSEMHSTSRHLNEYTSLDVEFGFIKNHFDIMEFEERLLRFMIKHLQNTCEKEFKLFEATLPNLPKEAFPKMKLKDALALIAKETGENCTNEPDLAPEHERWLSEYAKNTFDSDFIFITHYPVKKRPFYTYEDEEDKGYTKSFDLLFKGVEITTGGQRVHEYDKLVERIEEWGLDSKKFEFYLQAFKYGLPPHGGWGMGLERLTQKILNLNNVKEAALFPREINRIDTLLSGKHKDK